MADRLIPPQAGLLVCVGPNPACADLIRAAKNMADTLQTEWFAVYVENPRMLRLPEVERNRAVYNLRLAEQLGAETVTLRGRSIAEEIVNFARGRHLTKIVAGKPHGSRWRTIISGSSVDELVRLSGEIEVDIIAGEPSEPEKTPILVQPKPLRLPGYEIGSFISSWPPASPF